MNYGMYISASGALSSIARQNVASNNLSNVNTPGYKPDSIAVRQRDAARIEDDMPFAESNTLIERLGAGVMPTETFVGTEDAPLKKTDQPLDVALRGEGYFVVRQGEGEEALRLTRDGQFTLNSDNQLVRVADGAPVLDENGQGIRLDPASRISIDADGVISEDGQPAARLRVATVNEPAHLVKEGTGIFRPSDASGGIRDGEARVVQGSIEDSGVNPFSTIMAVTGASKAVQGNMQMIGIFNQTMQRTINTLGRVS